MSRSTLGRHYTTTKNHQQDLVANATFVIPHHRKRLGTGDSILDRLKQELPGSGFRLEPVVINAYERYIEYKTMIQLEVNNQNCDISILSTLITQDHSHGGRNGQGGQNGQDGMSNQGGHYQGGQSVEGGKG